MVLVPGELSCNWSSCAGTLCSISLVVCGWLMVVRWARIWKKLVVVCVEIAQVGFYSGGLGRNLWHGAGIGFGADGLEMVVFYVWK